MANKPPSGHKKGLFGNEHKKLARDIQHSRSCSPDEQPPTLVELPESMNIRKKVKLILETAAECGSQSKQLARATLPFVPGFLLNYLMELDEETRTSESPTPLQQHRSWDLHSRRFAKVSAGTVLLADVTGYSKVANQLSGGSHGNAKVIKTLNGFFSPLVDLILENGGDVINFAGDAIIAFWTNQGDSKFDGPVAKAALACAMQASALEISVEIPASTEVVHLSLHSGLASGRVCLLSVGGGSRRNEYELVMIGDPLKVAGEAQRRAHSRGLVICNTTHDRVQDVCECHQALPKTESSNALTTDSTDTDVVTDTNDVEVATEGMILSDDTQRVEAKETLAYMSLTAMNENVDESGLESDAAQHLKTEAVHNRRNARSDVESLTYAVCDELGIEVEMSPTTYWHVDKLKTQLDVRFVQLKLPRHVPNTSLDNLSNNSIERILDVVSCYVPSVALRDLCNAKIQLQFRRHVSTLFAQLGSFGFDRISENGDMNPMLSILDDIFKACQQCVNRYEGMIRQFIVDDKGCILIVCFGISMHAHLKDQDRVISTAFDLSYHLSRIAYTNKKPVTIGIYTGQAVVGQVGRERMFDTTGGGHEYKRQDYAVVGNCVNMASRLMGKFTTHNIVCDVDTMQRSEDYMFQLVDTSFVPKGGKSMEVFAPIACRLSPSKVQNSLDTCVGREDEKKLLMSHLQSFNEGVIKRPFLVIGGDYGCGKSVLLNWVRLSIATSFKKLNCINCVATENTAKVNYLALQPLLQRVFGQADNTFSMRSLDVAIERIASKCKAHLKLDDTKKLNVEPTATVKEEDEEGANAGGSMPNSLKVSIDDSTTNKFGSNIVSRFSPKSLTRTMSQKILGSGSTSTKNDVATARSTFDGVTSQNNSTSHQEVEQQSMKVAGKGEHSKPSRSGAHSRNLEKFETILGTVATNGAGTIVKPTRWKKAIVSMQDTLHEPSDRASINSGSRVLGHSSDAYYGSYSSNDSRPKSSAENTDEHGSISTRQRILELFTKASKMAPPLPHQKGYKSEIGIDVMKERSVSSGHESKFRKSEMPNVQRRRYNDNTVATATHMQHSLETSEHVTQLEESLPNEIQMNAFFAKYPMIYPEIDRSALMYFLESDSQTIADFLMDSELLADSLGGKSTLRTNSRRQQYTQLPKPESSYSPDQHEFGYSGNDEKMGNPEGNNTDDEWSNPPAAQESFARPTKAPKRKLPKSKNNGAMAAELLKLLLLLALQFDDHRTVIMVDCLHFLDNASRSLLACIHHCVHDVAVVGTAWISERSAQLGNLKQSPGQGNPTIDCLTENHIKFNLFMLTTLNSDAIHGLLMSTFNWNHIPRELVRCVHKTSKGNPLWALELVKGMLIDGTLKSDEASTRVVVLKSLKDLGQMSHGLYGAILYRYDRLSPVQQDVLKHCVVADTHFTLRMIGELVQHPNRDQVEPAFENLVRQGFLVKDKESSSSMMNEDQTKGERTYSVSHTYYQRVIYDTLSPTESAVMHAKTAKWLEQHNNSYTKWFPVLAHHYERAGNKIEALRCFRSGAQYHFRYGQDEKGCEYLIQALALGEQLLGSGDTNTSARHVAEMLVLLAQRQVMKGDINHALETVNRLSRGTYASNLSSTISVYDASPVVTTSRHFGKLRSQLFLCCTRVEDAPALGNAKSTLSLHEIVEETESDDDMLPDEIEHNSGCKGIYTRLFSRRSRLVRCQRKSNNVLSDLNWGSKWWPRLLVHMFEVSGGGLVRTVGHEHVPSETAMHAESAIHAKVLRCVIYYCQLNYKLLCQELNSLARLLIQIGVSRTSTVIRALSVFANSICVNRKCARWRLVSAARDTANVLLNTGHLGILSKGFMLQGISLVQLNLGEWDSCIACITQAQQCLQCVDPQALWFGTGEFQCLHIQMSCLILQGDLMEALKVLRKFEKFEMYSGTLHFQIEVWSEVWQTVFYSRCYGSVLGLNQQQQDTRNNTAAARHEPKSYSNDFGNSAPEPAVFLSEHSNMDNPNVTSYSPTGDSYLPHSPVGSYLTKRRSTRRHSANVSSVKVPVSNSWGDRSNHGAVHGSIHGGNFGSIQEQHPQSSSGGSSTNSYHDGNVTSNEQPSKRTGKRFSNKAAREQILFVDRSGDLMRADWLLLCSIRAWKFAEFAEFSHQHLVAAYLYAKRALDIFRSLRAQQLIVVYLVFAFEATFMAMFKLYSLYYRKGLSAGPNDQTSASDVPEIIEKGSFRELMEKFDTFTKLFPQTKCIKRRCEGLLLNSVGSWMEARSRWQDGAKLAEKYTMIHESRYSSLLSALVSVDKPRQRELMNELEMIGCYWTFSLEVQKLCVIKNKFEP